MLKKTQPESLKKVMDGTQVMAFDLGASNGRAIVATYDKGKIVLNEVHRFANDPVKLNKHTYWDFPRLFHELKQSLIKAKNQGYKVKSVGIDTWGVDYGLLDTEGELINNPVHYRDERSAEGMAMLLSRYDGKEFKVRTGMDCFPFNTVNQLINDRHAAKDEATALLNMPDLFNYFLTGVMSSEFSMASTTQLYDYNAMEWNHELIKELKIDDRMFQKVISSGTVVGDVKDEILEELKINPLKVVSVTSHDTASAIRSIPADEDDFLFIATGTWIVCGSKQQSMTMNDKVLEYDLTNEGGNYPNVNLLKNHVGLWILQESKRHWEKTGIQIGFGEMVTKARASKIDSMIDIMDTRFYGPGDMPKKVKDYCEETDQVVPSNIGEVVLVIEQSLAKQIAKTLSQIEEATDKSYTKVHIFGGGVQDGLLCELIAKYTGKEVVIGPKEATAFGNVIDQFVALKVFDEKDTISIMNASI